jgi:hypothetical protein
VAAEAPWWGIPVVAGLFTLLGAALSQLVNYLIERGRRERQKAERWDQDLRECAARLLVLVNDDEEQWSAFYGTEQWQHHNMTSREAFVALQFVATDEIASAAHEFMDLVYGKVLGDYATEGESGKQLELDIRAARNKFVDAVRDRLGVDSLTIDSY